MDQKKQILKLARERGMIRAEDVEAIGLSRNYLYAIHKEGLLQRNAPGLYAAFDYELNEYSSIVEVSKRIPNAVVGLISALNFHEMTTQVPYKVWVIVPRGAWVPRIEYPPVNINYVSGSAYEFGIQEHVLNGVTVKIYSAAKTVADCFKFRNKIGLDVCLEALREVRRSKKATFDELAKAAKINRVLKIMLPYMEMEAMSE